MNDTLLDTSKYSSSGDFSRIRFLKVLISRLWFKSSCRGGSSCLLGVFRYTLPPSQNLEKYMMDLYFMLLEWRLQIDGLVHLDLRPVLHAAADVREAKVRCIFELVALQHILQLVRLGFRIEVE